MDDSRLPFDRSLLVARRNRVAGRADEHTFLLQRVADDFSDRLKGIKRDFPVGLNLGAYNGLLSRELRALANVGELVDVEPSLKMLEACEGVAVCGDEEFLPFGSGALDLVVSGLSLQLVNDLPGALIQVVRALKPDGLFMAAMLGRDTLWQLREAWLVAEDEVLGGASPRVAPFADLRAVGTLLQRAGFALPVVDMDRVTVTYASPLALMRELKGMGASNMLNARVRRPVVRGLLARACEVYLERFGVEGGRVEATFEIITVTAWVPHSSQQKPLKPGSARVRLADALGVSEHSAGDKTG